MRTGIHLDLRNPPRWRRPWPDFYARALDLVDEAERLGADIRQRYAITDRRAREIRHRLEADTPTPPAVQRPLPMRMGCQGPRGARRAGGLGAGLLSLDRSLLEPSRQGLAEGRFDPDGARMAGLLNAVVNEDPDAAWEPIREHFAHQVDTHRRYGSEGTGRPAPAPVDPEVWRGPGPGRADFGGVASQ